jgi:hypothetical protein
MLTTPPGTSRGVQHLVEIGGHQRPARRGPPRPVAHRDRGRDRGDEAQQRRSGGQTTPITPIGSGIAIVTLRIGV